MTKFFEQFAFHDPWWLLGLLILAPLFFLRNVHGSESGIDFPSLSILSSVGTRPRERAGRFTTLLFCLVLLTGILGLARPNGPTPTPPARRAELISSSPSMSRTR